MYTVILVLKGPMIPKSVSYIMFTDTIKAAGEKSTRHLLKIEERRAEIGLRTSKGFACLCFGYTLS